MLGAVESQRPAPSSVFSDQRRTKSTIWSRTSGGVQVLVRAPQGFFLSPCARPSARPELHPWSGSFSPTARCVPVRAGDCRGSWSGRRRRFQRILSASGTTPSAAAPARRRASRLAPCPADAVSVWRPLRRHRSHSAQATHRRGGRCLSIVGRSKGSVQHLVADEGLPVVRSDRRVFLDILFLDRWIERNKQEAQIADMPRRTELRPNLPTQEKARRR